MPNTIDLAAHSLIRPLEQLASLDADLDGHSGSNRAPDERLQIEANHDLAAVHCFLAEYRHSAGTYRVYQKECERLLLWAVAARGKPLSSLHRQDFEAYIAFLADPQPAERWCGPKRPRQHAEWRPFVGPLGEAARISAVGILKTMLDWLVEAGYLAANPLGLMRQHRKLARRAKPQEERVERFLDGVMWQAVMATVEAMPRDTAKQIAAYERLRFICALLYLLGPRAGELESHTMNSFRELNGHWWWQVVGKGEKRARIPVGDDMLAALARYRRHLRREPSLPLPDDTTPLLLSLSGDKGITARRLHQLLKALFNQAADRLESETPHKAARLRQASTHWGRHTAITAKLNAGIDRRYVQRSARHEDPRTTDRYIHEEDTSWHEAEQLHRLDWPSS